MQTSLPNRHLSAAARSGAKLRIFERLTFDCGKARQPEQKVLTVRRQLGTDTPICPQETFDKIKNFYVDMAKELFIIAKPVVLSPTIYRAVDSL